MKNPRLTRRPLAAVFSIAAILALFQGFSGQLFAQFPAGDLTVTVEELDGGEVRFSLSGSAPLREEGGFDNTGYDPIALSPPHTLSSYTNYPLPAGLTLSAAGNDRPVTNVYFDSQSFWWMGSFSSGTFPQGTNVTGSGTGVSSTIPFSNFVPGTYEVAGQAFDVTYRVITKPAPAPRLALSGPGRFPATLVGRSSRPRTLRITNTGNAEATGLSLAISGKAARDFKSTRPPAALAAGGSATVKVTFNPRAKGARKAEAIVTAANTAAARAALLGKGK